MHESSFSEIRHWSCSPLKALQNACLSSKNEFFCKELWLPQNHEIRLLRYTPLKINWFLRIAFKGPLIDENFQNFPNLSERPQTWFGNLFKHFFELLSWINPKTTILYNFERKKFWPFLTIFHCTGSWFFGVLGSENEIFCLAPKAPKTSF